MYYIKYNDYEMLYLINEGCEPALDYMYHKYSIYIKKVLHQYYANELVKQELFQEGLLILNKAIQTYNYNYNKTFIKYFDFILKRRFGTLLERKVYEGKILLEPLEETVVPRLEEVKHLYLYKDIMSDTNIDQRLFQECFIEKLSLVSYCKKYNLSYIEMQRKVKQLKQYLRKKYTTK